MSQSSLLTKNSLTFPHRQTPVEHHREYLPLPKPVFDLEEHETRWEQLTNDDFSMKPMVNSLAIHDETIHRLGMQSWIYDMFRRVSLNPDVIFGLPAYKELVYEFLSTLEIHDDDGFQSGYSAWEFRIQQQHFFWTRKEACEMLGFPTWGLCYLATEQQRLNLWKDLTQDFICDVPSSYSIKNPAWRYAHRLIATGINCCPESVNVVSKDDLNVMWALEQSEPINWFDVFSEKFRAMQSGYTKIPYVGCTSLITFIAEICNFRFSNCLAEYRELDMGMLKKLRMIAGVPEQRDTSEEEDPSEERTETDPPEYPSEEHSIGEPFGRSPYKGKTKAKFSANKKKKSKKTNSGIEWVEVRKVVIKEYRNPGEDTNEVGKA